MSIARLARRAWQEAVQLDRDQVEERYVPDQERRAHDSESDLQAALQTLLQANLGDQVLRSQDRTLLGARKCATAQSTTDEVTDHQGHQ